MRLRLCKDPDCKVSTGIHGGPTFGKGYLDPNGYWEFPCETCAEKSFWAATKDAAISGIKLYFRPIFGR